MIELTDEQQLAVKNGQTVHIQPTEIGKRVVVLLEEQYEKLLHEDEGGRFRLRTKLSRSGPGEHS